MQLVQLENQKTHRKLGGDFLTTRSSFLKRSRSCFFPRQMPVSANNCPCGYPEGEAV